ncbi:MAG: hypothetical protein AB7D47_04405 [Desulfovibrio sp.]|jgi:predicted amidophosphoribosyltransferase
MLTWSLRRKRVRICSQCGEVMSPDEAFCRYCASPELQTTFLRDALRLARQDEAQRTRLRLAVIRRVAA